MEDINKNSEITKKINEVVDLLNASLLLIQKKIADLEKSIYETKDKEKMVKIKNKINNLVE